MEAAIEWAASIGPKSAWRADAAGLRAMAEQKTVSTATNESPSM